MELTTIQISKEIREYIKSFRTTNRESYDEILRRILPDKKEVQDGTDGNGL